MKLKYWIAKKGFRAMHRGAKLNPEVIDPRGLHHIIKEKEVVSMSFSGSYWHIEYANGRWGHIRQRNIIEIRRD